MIWHPWEETHTVGNIQFLNHLLQYREHVSPTDDHQETVVQKLHCLHQFLRPSLDVDARPLQYQQVLVRGQTQSHLVAFWRQGLSRWYIPDYITLDTIFITEQVGDAVANGNHFRQFWDDKSLYLFPHLLHLRPTNQLWSLRKVLMAVENHPTAFQP